MGTSKRSSDDAPAEPDWPRLERLRSGFLHATGRGLADYWQSDEDLAAYDEVFAPRIGWKWGAVLAELQGRGVRLDASSLLDVGCGSGIATRTVLPALEHLASLPRVALHDRSVRAMEFARRRCLEEFPAALCETQPRLDGAAGDLDLVLVSHVLTELSEASVAPILEVARQARTLLWVEPGTKDASRRLAALVDPLREQFDVLAPCTHAERCRALVDGDQDWCHFFATPPATVFTDPWWVQVGRRLKIDLRALPYCFVALRAKEHPLTRAPAPPRRLLGRPDVRSKFARFHVCDATGLEVREVFKGRDPALYRRLKKEGSGLRWPD